VPKLSQVIQIDEGKIQAHLGEVVRSTVEETLNALLDAEADLGAAGAERVALRLRLQNLGPALVANRCVEGSRSVRCASQRSKSEIPA